MHCEKANFVRFNSTKPPQIPKGHPLAIGQTPTRSSNRVIIDLRSFSLVTSSTMKYEYVLQNENGNVQLSKGMRGWTRNFCCYYGHKRRKIQRFYI